MEEHVRVGVPQKAPLKGDGHAAQDQGAALRQPVYVVAQADPRHGRSSLRRKSSQARSMSSGVVILMFS